MTEYRRPQIPDATWFFMVTLAQHHGNDLLLDHIERLRSPIGGVKTAPSWQPAALAICCLLERTPSVASSQDGEYNRPVRLSGCSLGSFVSTGRLVAG